MEQAHNVANQALKSLQSNARTPSTQINKLDAKLLSRFWIRMTSIYGQLWSSRWPTESLQRAAQAEWSLKLAEYSANEIGKALDLCIQSHKMPPTLPEFLMLFREETTNPAHKLYAALPKPAPNSELAKRAISEMRDKLNHAKRRDQAKLCERRDQAKLCERRDAALMRALIDMKHKWPTIAERLGILGRLDSE